MAGEYVRVWGALLVTLQTPLLFSLSRTLSKHNALLSTTSPSSAHTPTRTMDKKYCLCPVAATDEAATRLIESNESVKKLYKLAEETPSAWTLAEMVAKMSLLQGWKDGIYPATQMQDGQPVPVLYVSTPYFEQQIALLASMTENIASLVDLCVANGILAEAIEKIVELD